MAHILIVEDDLGIVDIITAYLGRSRHTCTAVHRGRDAQAAFGNEDFDLIILDLMLPDISGEELCRFFRSQSQLPILMLTAKSSESSLLYGFRLGADDYVTKPFSPRELMVRVDALLKRSRSEPLGSCRDFEDFRIDMDRQKIWKNDQIVPLTVVEFDIFVKLSSYPMRIFNREEILRTCRGPDFNGSDRTVDSHIRNLRAKIEDEPGNPRYIITERGKGFYFNDCSKS